MSLEEMKQELIKETEELIELGIDSSDLLRAIKRGDLDDVIEESGEKLKASELGDLCFEMISISGD